MDGRILSEIHGKMVVIRVMVNGSLNLPRLLSIMVGLRLMECGMPPRITQFSLSPIILRKERGKAKAKERAKVVVVAGEGVGEMVLRVPKTPPPLLKPNSLRMVQRLVRGVKVGA